MAEISRSPILGTARSKIANQTIDEIGRNVRVNGELLRCIKIVREAGGRALLRHETTFRHPWSTNAELKRPATADHHRLDKLCI